MSYIPLIFYEIMYYDDTWKIPRITDCSYDVYMVPAYYEQCTISL